MERQNPAATSRRGLQCWKLPPPLALGSPSGDTRGGLAADEQREVDVEDGVGQVGQGLGPVREHVRGDQLACRADCGAEKTIRGYAQG